MSVKKQIPSLCKLFSYYEEITELFSDETDVDSIFTTLFLEVPSPSIENHKSARAPTKNVLKSSCSNFAVQKIAALYLPRRNEYFQKRTRTLRTTLGCGKYGAGRMITKDLSRYRSK